MKITPLLRYPPTTTWHNSHHLPLHNRGTLPPVHELFKRPSSVAPLLKQSSSFLISESITKLNGVHPVLLLCKINYHKKLKDVLHVKLDKCCRWLWSIHCLERTRRKTCLTLGHFLNLFAAPKFTWRVFNISTKFSVSNSGLGLKFESYGRLHSKSLFRTIFYFLDAIHSFQYVMENLHPGHIHYRMWVGCTRAHVGRRSSPVRNSPDRSVQDPGPCATGR
jgi:hypothetical protein